MKKLRILLTLFLGFIICFTLVGCGSNGEGGHRDNFYYDISYTIISKDPSSSIFDVKIKVEELGGHMQEGEVTDTTSKAVYYVPSEGLSTFLLYLNSFEIESKNINLKNMGDDSSSSSTPTLMKVSVNFKEKELTQTQEIITSFLPYISKIGDILLTVILYTSPFLVTSIIILVTILVVKSKIKKNEVLTEPISEENSNE